MTLNLLRDYKGFKAEIKRKRKKAVLNTCYIEEVLASGKDHESCDLYHNFRPGFTLLF